MAAPGRARRRHECYAITEEFAGSDVSALETTARLDGDAYVVNGTKWHVTSYNVADYCFVQAVLTDGPHAGEHVLLVVDLPTPGIEVVRTPAYSHNIADHHPIVSFTDVASRSASWSAREGEGMTFAHDWFRFERVMVAARCVGAASRLLDEMTAFAGSRIVGGQRLGDYQLVAAMLADSATELFAARAMLYEVARAIDAGDDRKVLHARASMIKLPCSEIAGRVADRAVQVFGGRGYMRENVAERMFRELRVERIWEGAAEMQRRDRRPAAAQAGPPRCSATYSPNRHSGRNRDGTTKDRAGSRGRRHRRWAMVAVVACSAEESDPPASEGDPSGGNATATEPRGRRADGAQRADLQHRVQR